MAKKARSKARNQHKGRPRPSTVSKQKPEVEDGEDCKHYDKKDACLDRVLLKIHSLEARCEECRVDFVQNRRGGKGKAKGAKKKGESGSVGSEEIWVCLSCGYHGCGGVNVSSPCGHARRHSKKEHHLLAARLDDPMSGWCFHCNFSIRIEMPEGLEVNPKSTSSNGDRLSGGDDIRVCKADDDVGGSLGADTMKGYVVRGLINLGNTCFFNSVMQNLFATSMLRGYFLSLTESRGPLTVALKKLFNETNVGVESKKGSINPKNIFGCICSKAPQFKGYEQQDSHELLRYLLDGLCMEELNARKSDGSYCEDRGASQRVPTFVDVIFGGQLSSTVCCVECGHCSVVHEPFLDLSLPVPSKKVPHKNAAATPLKKNKPRARAVPKGRRTRERGSVKISNLNQWKSDTVGESLGSTKQNKIQFASSSSESGESYFSSVKEEQQIALPEENALFWLDYVEPAITAEIIYPISEEKEKHKMDPSKVHTEQTVTQESSGEMTVLHMQVQDNEVQSSEEATDVQLHNQDAEVESSVETIKIPMKVQDVVGSSGKTNEATLRVQNLEVGYLDKNNGVPLKGEDVGSLVESNDIPVQVHVAEIGYCEEASEVPLQVQDAEVLLLPYTELMSSAKRTSEEATESNNVGDYVATNANLMNKSDDAFSTLVACESTEIEFDGLGDLFAEPEITSDVRPGRANLEDVETSWLFETNSESNQEEVDNTNAPVSVFTCLAHFTKPELLSDEHAWHCENCSEILQDQINKNCEANQEGILCDKTNEAMHSVVDAYKVIGNTSTFSLEGNSDSCSENITLVNGKSANSIDNVVSDVEVHRNVKFDACTSMNPLDHRVSGCTLFKSKKIRSEKNLEQSDSPQNFCEISEKDEEVVGSDASQYFSCVSNVEKISSEMNSCVPCSNSCSRNELNDDACEVQSLSLGTFPHSFADHREENGASTSVDFQMGNKNGKKTMNKHLNKVASEPEKLKVKRDATKRILIDKAPHILTIHLKRFSQDVRGRLNKSNGHVSFQEVLDLAPYMDPRSRGIEGYSFRLVGVVEHSGSMRSGHYVAYVRGEKPRNDGDGGAWFYISDAHVREVSLTEVLRCEAYILFYERIQH